MFEKIKAFFIKFFAYMQAPVKIEPKVEPESQKKDEEQKKTPIIPPWFSFAKKYSGKNESEPAFNKEMSAKWSLFGMNLGTISQNWAAWCGLAIAVSLSGAGLKYAKDGALARNWGKYGTEIQWKTEGIPKGAIVWINHNANCSSSASNHVTMSDGDCAPQDLNKTGAIFNGYGGNQGNTWKVSPYPVSHICSVRWPSDYPKRGKIEKSIGCNGSSSSKESTL